VGSDKQSVKQQNKIIRKNRKKRGRQCTDIKKYGAFLKPPHHSVDELTNILSVIMSSRARRHGEVETLFMGLVLIAPTAGCSLTNRGRSTGVLITTHIRHGGWFSHCAAMTGLRVAVAQDQNPQLKSWFA